MICARDDHLTRLERLAQRVEHTRLEFRQLVEEEHAEVREAGFPRLWPSPAANERRHARRVMWGTERTRGRKLASHELARKAVHHRDFEHLLRAERRQD